MLELKKKKNYDTTIHNHMIDNLKDHFMNNYVSKRALDLECLLAHELRDH